MFDQLNQNAVETITRYKAGSYKTISGVAPDQSELRYSAIAFI